MHAKPTTDVLNDPQSALLTDLTPPQRAAVTTTEGPVLVLAAAGSGKTRVITRRIAYLLGMGIPPWQIMALTFTNKAAGEMRERVAHLLDDRHSESGATSNLIRGLTISTFHALCARLLRRYAPMMEGKPRWGLKNDYTIYDSDDQQSLMKRVLKEMDLSTTNWPAGSMLSAVSDAKNKLLDAEAYNKQFGTSGDFFGRTIAKVYLQYEKALRAANAADFDDLMVLTVRILRECEEARNEVQDRWRYLMIDEYQDTNHAQFVLATLLCTGHDGRPPNVCVVGDPDQSIYGWRGADISNILDFESQYPGATVIPLGQNFRSTAPILAAADTLIRNNRRRKHKDLFTTRQGGAKPMLVMCRDEHHEAELVVDWVKALHEGESPSPLPPPSGRGSSSHLEWKDIAVLYRNNALSRVIEDAMRKAGIPYIIARGTAFYQREEVKDAIAYLRVLANPADDVSLRRIVNKPARKIGGTSFEHVETLAASREMPLMLAMRHAGEISDLSPAAVNAMQKFTGLIDHWSSRGTFMGAETSGGSGSLSELVSRVLKESGLEDYYKALKEKSGAEADEAKLDNLQELVSSAAEFESTYDPTNDPALDAPRANTTVPAVPPLLAMLRAYLESVSLVADADKVDPASGAVTLMTLHAAKGLEFPAIAIIGLEESTLPGSRALESDEQLEEERRLMFVGITRAMEHLHITSAKYRTHRGLRERAIPSRFLNELPKEQLIVSDQSDMYEGFEDDEFSGWGRDTGSLRQTSQRSESGATRDSQRSESGGVRSPSSTPFPVGCMVRHPQFGVGKVDSISMPGPNARVKIIFRDVGAKTLILSFARLQRL